MGIKHGLGLTKLACEHYKAWTGFLQDWYVSIKHGLGLTRLVCKYKAWTGFNKTGM